MNDDLTRRWYLSTARLAIEMGVMKAELALLKGSSLQDAHYAAEKAARDVLRESMDAQQIDGILGDLRSHLNNVKTH